MTKPLPSPVLILGGSSSIGQSMIEELLRRNFSIVASSRRAGPSVSKRVNVDWVALDLSSSESCNAFMDHVGKREFSAIALLIGEMSPLVTSDNLTEGEVKDYFQSHVTNYGWLIHRIAVFAASHDTKILYLSSRATVYGSHDYFYSSAKAAIASLVKSLAKNSDLRAKTLSIAPGLIEGSGMVRHFSLTDLESHRRRSNYSLWSVDQLANHMCDLLVDSSVDWNGETIEIGPRYR